MDRARLLEAGAALAERLWECRVRVKDGSVTWLRPMFAQAEKDYRLSPIEPYLYTGTAGIALFFAAAARVLGGSEHRQRSLHIIMPLRRLLSRLAAEPERAMRNRMGVGGMTGLGSYVYSLLRIGTLLEEPSLVEEARALTALFTPDRIAADNDFDVSNGSAGAILALLALEGAVGEGVTGPALRAASLCARHLLDRRTSYHGHPRAWPWPGAHEGAPLTGFSHGASGIACALLLLYGRTGEPELREAAYEGFEFERSFYSPERRNWRDLRSPVPQFMCSWCHGAPGVALGRIATLDLADDREIREEIQNALDTTMDLEATWLDSLCCGSFGRAEILLHASRKLGEQHLLEEALRIVSLALRHPEEKGDFGWLPIGWENLYDPSLLRGAAGVGYALLQLAAPDSLPCLLLLE